MSLRPFECRIRRLLILIFLLSFLVVAIFTGITKFVEIRSSYIDQMTAQMNIAQNLISGFVLRYDNHFIEVADKCRGYSTDEVGENLLQSVHSLDVGDIFYLIDHEQRIVLISQPYQDYVGMSFVHTPFFDSPHKISAVHQSFFTNKSVVTMQYPTSCGMTLVIERDIVNIMGAMDFFENGKIFSSQIMFVLTSEGVVAYHPDEKLVRSRHNLGFDMKEWAMPAAGKLFSYGLDGEKFFALKKEFDLLKGWTLYFSVPARSLFNPILQAIMKQFIMVLFFFGIFYFVLQFFLNRYFSRPVRNIVAALNEYEFPQKSMVVDEKHALGVEEFAALIQGLNAMAAEIDRSSRDLRENEIQIRLLLNSTAEGIYGLDTSGNCTFCNSSFLRMMGYENEKELLGRNMHQLIHHSHADGSSYPVDECLAHAGVLRGDKAHSDDEVFWRSDGSSFSVEYRSYPVLDEEDVVGAVVSFVDITERKEAARRLEAEKEQLAVTLRSIGDAVITTDIDGRVVLVNRVAEDITGWSQQEACGKSLQEIFHIVDGHDGTPRHNPVDKVQSSGIVELESNTKLITRDGREREIADSCAPIRDRQNRIIGVVLVFRDVTVQNKMQAEAIRAHKLESVGILAGGIAHDFNNVLTAILGNISLVERIKDFEKQKPLLANAEKACMRAKGLTQQLLTFARGGEPIRETASIHDVIRDSADFVLQGSNVACNFTIPDTLWLVKIDKGQISQVVQNIALNAKNAMPKGGVIDIVCENWAWEKNGACPAPGNYVRVTIKDTGIGISAENIEKIFDPYFTTRDVGHGLGLAVTRSIIAKHNGYIEVVSKLGEGTAFIIYLPAERGHPILEKHPVKEVDAKGAGRILIMDDEEIVRDVAANMLGLFGYDALLCADGEAMLEIYKRETRLGNPVDLVIMDLTIPGGMGGKEAVGRLLEIDANARAVVASGYSNDPVMVDCLRFGFREAIVKPFQMEALAGVVKKVME